MDRLISRKQIADRPLWDGQSSTNWRARNTTARERSESPQFSTHKQHERTTKTPRLNYSSSLNQQTSNQTPSPSADLQESPVLDDGRRICVANLLYKAQMSDIRSLFERNGFKIERLDMSIDPFTGRNPSYCFVDLSSKEQADLAITSLNSQLVLDRPVKVKPAVRKSAKPGPSWYGKRYAGRPHNAYDSPERASPTFDRWARSRVAERWAKDPWHGKRLFVGGLPRMAHQAAVDEEVRGLFGAFTITAVSKILSPRHSKCEEPAQDRAGPGRDYFVFIDFPDCEEAEAACKAMDGVEPKWRGRLHVSHAKTDYFHQEKHMGRR